MDLYFHYLATCPLTSFISVISWWQRPSGEIFSCPSTFSPDFRHQQGRELAGEGVSRWGETCWPFSPKACFVYLRESIKVRQEDALYVLVITTSPPHKTWQKQSKRKKVLCCSWFHPSWWEGMAELNSWYHGFQKEKEITRGQGRIVSSKTYPLWPVSSSQDPYSKLYHLPLIYSILNLIIYSLRISYMYIYIMVTSTPISFLQPFWIPS